ncbi:MAG: hypothetical protein M1480_16710 [Bacteroidetes bacterium]|nr:hypothetical protein [Bacteroidota bacterium]
MKKNYLFLVISAVIIFSGLINSQTLSSSVVGKLYSKAEADQIYGPVLQSITINTSALSAITAKTPNYIMFNIINGQLYILNSTRTVLSGPATAVSANQVFRYFSTSIVNQLIQQGQASNTTVELRANNTLTVTNGNSTIEDAGSCPPVCF